MMPEVGAPCLYRAGRFRFSLEEIKQIIDDKRAGQSPCAEVRELVRLRLQELDERMHADIAKLAATTEGTRRAKHKGISAD